MIKKHIPNSITCLNLISGCIATYWALCGAWDTALTFDGMSARLLGVSSPIGKELDSLADDITFGLAPSAIIFDFLKTGTQHLPWHYLAYAAFIMAAFSALRLAKFNLDERQAMGFIGLPTPANALFWGALIASCQCIVLGSLDCRLRRLAALIAHILLCRLYWNVSQLMAIGERDSNVRPEV